MRGASVQAKRGFEFPGSLLWVYRVYRLYRGHRDYGVHGLFSKLWAPFGYRLFYGTAYKYQSGP